MSTSSLKLLPVIAENARRRCQQLNLGISAYVGILVWNQCQEPVPLRAEPSKGRHVRVAVPCSWKAAVVSMATDLAEGTELSRNALIEALIARDLRSQGGQLAILPLVGSAKPRIR